MDSNGEARSEQRKPSSFRQEADARRKAQQRENLLDAAERVFVAKGYHGTNVSDIVGAAGVGQGTLYRYFEDKRDLFEALFDRFTASLVAEFSPMTLNLPRSMEEYRDASVAALRSFAARAESNRSLVMLIVREGPTVDAAMAEKLSALYEQLAGLARMYLDHAVAAGFARPCDTEVVSKALVGIGLWLARQWWDGRLPGRTLGGLVEQAVDLAFLGFGRAESGAKGEGS
jgi:AcrR family transcriptional regulator